MPVTFGVLNQMPPDLTVVSQKLGNISNGRLATSNPVRKVTNAINHLAASRRIQEPYFTLGNGTGSLVITYADLPYIIEAGKLWAQPYTDKCSILVLISTESMDVDDYTVSAYTGDGGWTTPQIIIPTTGDTLPLARWNTINDVTCDSTPTSYAGEVSAGLRLEFDAISVDKGDLTVYGVKVLYTPRTVASA